MPQSHRLAFAHDPFLVGGVEMDLTPECVGPFVHRGVEMRVRDRNRFQAAETFEHADRRGIQRRNAVPHYVAVLSARQERALANREAGADADQAGVVFMETVHVALRQFAERSPGLTPWRHILPLFLADDALLGWTGTLRVLRAAGGADVKGHEFLGASFEDAGILPGGVVY